MTACGRFGRALLRAMLPKKFISLVFLVGLLIGLIYLMWIISRGYPFELALLAISRGACL